MGMNLYYRPVPSGKSLDTRDDKLKIRMRDKAGVTSSGKIFTRDDIPYLEGVRDGGTPDAQKVIDAIEKHEIIELYLQ